METRKVYRIEIPESKSGMWYDEHGEMDKKIHKLCPNSISSTIPMPYDELHRKDDKVWNSAGKSIENMNQWFTREDVETLVNNGFKLYEFIVTEWQELEMEILFTREGVVEQTEIPIDDVWEPINNIQQGRRSAMLN